MHDILVMEAVRNEYIDKVGNIENFVHFRFGDTFRSIYAENLLAQKFIKLMFTNPTPTSPIGGGIMRYVPETFHKSRLPDLRSKMAIVVGKTESDILKAQIGSGTPDEERLKKADLLDVTWDDQIHQIDVIIRVTALTGDTWILRLPLGHS